jgi:hypothetical protein
MGGCYYLGVALDPSHVTKIDKAWLEGPKGSHILLKPLAMFLLRLEFSLWPTWVCVISLDPVHCDLVYPSCCWYTEWERNDHDSNSCKFENWQEALAHLQHILHIHACEHNTSICTSCLNLGQSFDLYLFIAQQCIQTSIKSTKQGQVLASPCDRINASL